MAKPFKADVYAAGYSLDPSAPPGVAAPIGSMLPRLGTTELWRKFGAGDQDWSLFTASPGVYQNVESTASDTTGSLVYVVIPTTTIVVALAGVYLSIFNSVLHSSSTNGTVFFSFFINGVQVAGSERHVQSNGDKVITLIQPLTIGAGDTLDVRWFVDQNTGTVHDRNTTVVKIV